MILNIVSGSSGGAGGTLVVNAPAEVTVTTSKDDITKSKLSDVNGTATFQGLETGTWTVSITDGNRTTSQSVDITADYTVNITFFAATISVTYPSGSICTCTDGSTTLTAPDTTGNHVFTVGNAGNWTISCTDGSNNASSIVSITVDGITISVTLGYAFKYSYTGDSTFSGDASGDWELQLLTSGTLTVSDPGACNGVIDLYLLGGGGGGSTSNSSYSANSGTMYYGGGGGGGGYATNVMDGSVQLEEGDTVVATIGAGGSSGSTAAQAGTTTAVVGDSTYSAEGGRRSASRNGGKGGSGGGGGGVYADAGGAGGLDGADGKGKSNSAWNVSSSGGTGSGSSTLPFGEDNDIAYGCGGGGGGAYYSATGMTYSAGSTGGSTANRGMGGKGKTNNGSSATAGGSGIIIIRNHRAN